MTLELTDGANLLRCVVALAEPEGTETETLRQTIAKVGIVNRLLELGRQKQRYYKSMDKRDQRLNKGAIRTLLARLQSAPVSSVDYRLSIEEEPETGRKGRTGLENHRRMHREDVRMLYHAYGHGPASILQNVPDISAYYKHPQSQEILLQCILESYSGQERSAHHQYESEIPLVRKRPSITSVDYPSKKQALPAPPSLGSPAGNIVPHPRNSAYAVEEAQQNSTSPPCPTSSPPQPQKWMESDKNVKAEYIGRWMNSKDIIQIWRCPTLRAIKFLEVSWHTDEKKQNTDGIFDYYEISKPEFESLHDSNLLEDLQQSKQWEDLASCLTIGLLKDVQHPDASFCTIFIS